MNERLRDRIRRVWGRWREDCQAKRARRRADWERLHVTRHPDGNVEVHGASVRAVLRWYRRQHWASEWSRS